MELHEIRYFLAVCQTLNFTRAAEQCNVSQPALTRAIQKMEAELGGLLFSRERNNTHYTELGRLMQPHLEEVMARNAVGEGLYGLALPQAGGSAHLRLGVMCTIGPVRFASASSTASRADHRGIEMTLTEAVPSRLAEELLGGDLDIVVMAQPNGASRSRCGPSRSTPSASWSPARSGIPSRGATRSRWSDMDGQIYLQRINCEFRDVLRETCEARGAHIKTRLPIAANARSGSRPWSPPAWASASSPNPRQTHPGPRDAPRPGARGDARGLPRHRCRQALVLAASRSSCRRSAAIAGRSDAPPATSSPPPRGCRAPRPPRPARPGRRQGRAPPRPAGRRA